MRKCLKMSVLCFCTEETRGKEIGRVEEREREEEGGGERRGNEREREWEREKQEERERANHRFTGELWLIADEAGVHVIHNEVLILDGELLHFTSHIDVARLLREGKRGQEDERKDKREEKGTELKFSK